MSVELAPDTVNDSQTSPASVRVPSISSWTCTLASVLGKRVCLRSAGQYLLPLLDVGAKGAQRGRQTVAGR